MTWGRARAALLGVPIAPVLFGVQPDKEPEETRERFGHLPHQPERASGSEVEFVRCHVVRYPVAGVW